MGFYESLRDNTAGPLITQFGMSATLRRTIKGDYDKSTGKRAADTTVDYSCKVLKISYKDNMIDGTLVKLGDQRLLVSAKDLAITPIIGDEFILASETWYIPDTSGAVDTLAPGGITVMFTVQIRK